MKISDIAKKMMTIIGISVVFLVVGSVIFYRSIACLPFIYGVILAAVANIIKIVMLDITVKTVQTKGVDAVGRYVVAQNYIRLLLTAAIVIVAIYMPFINHWGTITEILMYRLAIYALKGYKINESEVKEIAQ